MAALVLSRPIVSSADPALDRADVGAYGVVGQGGHAVGRATHVPHQTDNCGTERTTTVTR